jgi:hypothetical protein
MMIKVVCWIILMFFSSYLVCGQNHGFDSSRDSRIDSPGVRGRVFGAYGMGNSNLIVVTDENITKIYGEYVLTDANIRYEIPNLPKGEPLYIHFLFYPRVWASEKIVISDWLTHDITIDINSYSGSPFGEGAIGVAGGILGLLGIADHYHQIYLQGKIMRESYALFQRIHYLRFVGQWEIKSGIVKTDFGNIELSGGGTYKFNEDGTATDPFGDKFYWQCHFEKTGVERRYGIRLRDEYHLVINMSDVSDFQSAVEIQASVYFEDFYHHMEWGENTHLVKIISDCTFIDSRDGQAYKCVKIGDQIWMAQNLNYDIAGASWCYGNISDNCSKYGRLYSRHPRIPVNSFQNTQHPGGFGVVEDAEEALVVDVGEGWFEQHIGFDGAVFLQVHDDVVDEGHLVGPQLTGLQKF